jgi:hypothetical protein
MADAIESFVKTLLSRPPAAPGSLQLEVETEDAAGLFEVLLIVMTKILKAWYPPPITIANISQEDVGRLVGYFASFGIQFELDVRPEPRVFRIDNRAYERKNRLEDMQFQMASGGNVYTVRFKGQTP